MRNGIVFAILCAGLLFMECANATGGSTETSTKVASMLYNPGGTPAVGVTVYIRPDTALADTSLGLPSTAGTDSTVTDNNGNYSFDTSLDAGTYVIEAASGNNAVLIDSVVVSAGPTPDTLPPDTLQPAGAIKGVVYLSEGGDPRKVFVLAFGIDRFTSVNADGSFKFSALARGNYNLRLISSLDDYDVLDTVGVPVLSADTTDLDTIRLPFTGIPTPRNLSVSYDTLMQIVALTWDSANANLVSSYNVYRRNVGLNTVFARINISPVTGTSYRDSTGVQDSVYEYSVAAVNTGAMEGTKCAGVTIYLFPIFSITESIIKGSGNADGQFGWGVRAASDTIGNFYITDHTNTWLQKLDSLGAFISKLDTFNQPSGITNAKEEFVYVSDYNNRQIVKVNLLGQVDTLYQTRGKPGAVLFYSDSLFVASDSGIEVYTNDSLAVIWSFSFDLSYSHMDLAVAPDGNLYIVDSKELYQVNRNFGSFVSIFTISDEQHNQSARATLLNQDTLLLLTTNAIVPFKSTIYVIDKNLGILTKWETIEAIEDIIIKTGQEITAFSGEGKIIKLRLNL
jgi:hypothetical protein